MYRAIRPPPALEAIVDAFWHFDATGSPHRVVPDGCIDVVWTQGAGTQVVGPNTRAFTVTLATTISPVGRKPRAIAIGDQPSEFCR